MDDDVVEIDKFFVGLFFFCFFLVMCFEYCVLLVENVNGVNGDGDIFMNGIISFDFSFDINFFFSS